MTNEELLAREQIRQPGRAIINPAMPTMPKVSQPVSPKMRFSRPSHSPSKAATPFTCGSKATRRFSAAATTASRPRSGLITSQASIQLVDQNRASIRAPCLVITDRGLDHSVIYHDKFRRAGDRWLIEKRVIDLLWRTDNSCIPSNLVGVRRALKMLRSRRSNIAHLNRYYF